VAGGPRPPRQPRERPHGREGIPGTRMLSKRFIPLSLSAHSFVSCLVALKRKRKKEKHSSRDVQLEHIYINHRAIGCTFQDKWVSWQGVINGDNKYVPGPFTALPDERENINK